MSADVKGIIRDHWNGRAARFDSCPNHKIGSMREREEWIRLFSHFIGKQPLRILDVGTGTGVIALLLAEEGHTVTGVDLAENMLEEARKKVREHGIMAEFLCGDAERLQFPDATFDVVVNRHLLWTLPHPEQALAEWKRVLAPGGRLVIIDGEWSRLQRSFWCMFSDYFAILLKRRPPSSIRVYRRLKIDGELPMQTLKRPEADIEMIERLGFAVRYEGVGPGKTFFNTEAFGKITGGNRFVLCGEKAA
jgi:ubiquinone/menaquinone biosynthesis C-methylase UbiE